MTETDPPSSGPRVRSRWPGRLLRTTLVIACLAYALWNVDPTSLLETLADIDPLRVLLVTLFTGFGYVALASIRDRS